EHVECCKTGKAGLIDILGERRSPIGHDGVADIFVDDSSMIADRCGHFRKVSVHDLYEPLGRHSLARAGKSFAIAEQHGHDVALAVDGKHRSENQAFNYAGVDIFAEGLADVLLMAKLLDHPIKSSGQVANLVLRSASQSFV